MLEDPSLLWMLALAGWAAAGLLGLLWKRAGQAQAEVSVQLGQVKEEADTARAAAAKEKRSRERLSEELSGYRRKSEKAKRRKGKGAAAPLGTSARIQDLESELEKRGQERDRFEAECLAAAEDKRRLEGQLRALEAERSRLAAERNQLAAAPEPARPSAQPAEAPQATEVVQGSASGASAQPLAEALERAAKLEEQMEQARQTEARMRKRMSNQEQLYASLRAELDIKKDRLRAQEERIQRLEAMEVALSSK